jgi:hypothetical protein
VSRFSAADGGRFVAKRKDIPKITAIVVMQPHQALRLEAYSWRSRMGFPHKAKGNL